jgi:hypothetical protein
VIGIFCPASDLPALWVFQGLKRRGLALLEIFTPEALVYNRRLEHRLLDNETSTRIDLVDGRVLDSAAIQGVLNRITALPVEHFQAAVLADRQYAAQEQHAVFLSWLHSLPGVLLNRPGGRSLCGDLRSPTEWGWLAGSAGLPTLTFHQSDVIPVDFPGGSPEMDATIQIIILDGQIYGPEACVLPESFKEQLTQLAKLSGLRLCGVSFCRMRDGELLFASATPLPDLRLGGEALLDALAEALN